ncbi:MAG: sugar ABC transporter permease [Nitrososphaeria archaeon]
MVYVGLENVVFILSDPNYYLSAINTILFLIINVNLKVWIALAIALIMKKPFKGNIIVKFIMMVIWASSYVPLLWTWSFILHPSFGILNYTLKTLGLISRPISFLSDPSINFYVLTLLHVWKNVPFWSIMFLAGLMSIPNHLYESAMVDGAGRFQVFLHITLPNLKNLFIINYVLTTIWTSGEFVTFQMLTGGGPFFKTSTIPVYAYLNFVGTASFNIPAAALVPVIPFILLGIFVVLRTKFFTFG